MNSQTQLSVIAGGKTERLFRRLINTPQSFDDDEFERLVDLFKDRISRAEAYDLTVMRLQFGEDRNGLEQRALLAIATGNSVEADRLTKLLTRRNELGLQLIVPDCDDRSAPPRSS